MARFPTAGDAVGKESGYRLAFEEARRALEVQERAEASLRARAGVVLGAAALTTSLLLGRPFEIVHGGWSSWVAIALFVISAGSAMLALWPFNDWYLTVSASGIIRAYLEPADAEPKNLNEIRRDLALYMEGSWLANEAKFTKLQLSYRLAIVALALETAVWAVGSALAA